MKLSILRPGAALALCVAPLLASAAFAAQQAPAEVAEPAPAEAASDKGDTKDTAEAPEAKAEEERICRYIKLDMSSRRKTKVCRTTQEWVELGNPR